MPPMSHMGHERRFRDRRGTSAYPPSFAVKADIPDRQVRAIPGLHEVGANGLSSVRKRFHQFADGLDEHLRDRAERPIFQGGDADRLSNVGQFHWQGLKYGMFARQDEREADDHSEETLRRKQFVS